ncbi:uncharacterized protein RAG0_16452 [Rhynchosporium agropyri]|uniref:Uncharacterized protein n=1 Tax=Rhynchosporium agropyri TaxID=914238 RepID=A0A1E1LQL0_9HELO|nr:uncharacterized protein RAG0_16452 [Rhynchosporium agropyri]
MLFVDIRERFVQLEQKIMTKGCLSSESRNMAKKLGEEATIVDQALQKWTTDFLEEWADRQYTLLQTLQFSTKDFYSSPVLIYQSLCYAGVWNLYFGTRILINCTLIQILDLISLEDYENNSRLSDYVAVINNMANDLASRIPFCRQIITVVDDTEPKFVGKTVAIIREELGEIHAGVTSVWPLSMATGLSRLGRGGQAEIWVSC